MYRTIGCMALVVMLAPGKLAASVNIELSSHRVQVYDQYTVRSVTVYASEKTIPISKTITATIDTGSAVTNLSRSVSPSQTLFYYSFAHVRPTAPDGYLGFAQSDLTYEVFTVDVPTCYSISGRYGMMGEGRIDFRCILEDMLTYETFFYNRQSSTHTPNEVFTLGHTEGDGQNSLEGSLTGTFQPGHKYRLWYTATIQSLPSASSASAEGYVSLAFVPEPSTLIIWSLLGTLAVTVGWWRRRKAA